jgi:hypothetical protein
MGSSGLSLSRDVPVFASERLLWDALLSDEHSWTRRDDGRILCRAHSQVADCDVHGHELSRWLQHPIEDDLDWRYCRHCGALFDQRITRRAGL